MWLPGNIIAQCNVSPGSHMTLLKPFLYWLKINKIQINIILLRRLPSLRCSLWPRLYSANTCSQRELSMTSCTVAMVQASHHAYLGCSTWLHSAIINIPSGSALRYIDYCFVYSWYIPGRHGVTTTYILRSLYVYGQLNAYTHVPTQCTDR